MAGNPVLHFTVQDTDSTLQVITNSFIVLHAPRMVGFKIDNPDVVGVPKNRYVFPNGVQSIFQALKPGTAVMTISYLGADEVCEIVAQCSTNWSGYVLQSGGPFTGVTAQWTVPTIASNSPNGESSSWVGIDGWGNHTVLQAGTEQDMGSLSGASYYAWYELFPANEQSIAPNPNLLGEYRVEPGDVIQVSITPAPGVPVPAANKSGNWVIQIVNKTQKWTYSTTQTYAGKLSSAEWIEEAVTENGLLSSSISTMPNYGSVLFDFKDQVATGGGPLGSPHFTTADEVSLNQLGVSGDYSTPSGPDADLDGFFVNYSQISPNPGAPPGPWVETTVLPPALVNQAYSQTLAVEDAATPTWTLTGSLPPGLVFSKTQGTITGTPTAAGNYPFSVLATDTSTGAFTQNQSLTIQVLTTSAGVLQVGCSVVSTIPTATLTVEVDGNAAPCGSAMTLAAGSHAVTGKVIEGGLEAYKISFAGTCNAAGIVTIVQSQTAVCTVVATATSIIDSSGCQVGQHCCDPSATGCKKCIAAKDLCQ
ncbi:MAG: G1 family glutamic endopeptidase [Terracidiphilus sp.]